MACFNWYKDEVYKENRWFRDLKNPHSGSAKNEKGEKIKGSATDVCWRDKTDQRLQMLASMLGVWASDAASQ
jgi:hypothetical protein